jgi:hypothetical protein
MDDSERLRRDKDVRTKGAWALVRLVLGLLQMTGAVVSFYLLFSSGMSGLSLSAVVLTCLCTTISVLLFGSRKAR